MFLIVKYLSFYNNEFRKPWLSRATNYMSCTGLNVSGFCHMYSTLRGNVSGLNLNFIEKFLNLRGPTVLQGYL